MTLGAPYTDVRIPTPHNWHFINWMPAIKSINLHPPASGREIELTFGTPEGTTPISEDSLKAKVEEVVGLPVLAIRQREAE